MVGRKRKYRITLTKGLNIFLWDYSLVENIN